MKGAIGCLVVVAMGFVLLIGATFFVMSRTADQSDLTREVPVEVVSSKEKRKNSSGHVVDYAYVVDGVEFTNQAWITNTGWMPGKELSACVDPDDPGRHVLRTTGTEICGDEFVSFSIRTAQPAD